MAGRLCDLEGCSRPHYGRGYCSMHWKRWNKYGDPLKTKLNKQHNGFCSIDGCSNDYYALGWCRKHHRRWQVHGSPNTVLTERCDDRLDFCVVSDCSDVHYAQDLCTVHYNAIVRHGLNVVIYEAMLSNQNEACAICEQKFVDTPNVDHDHDCCSGWKSCGACVRGLLCKGCNAALGIFKDDIAILRSAITYLQHPRRGVTAEYDIYLD